MNFNAWLTMEFFEPIVELLMLILLGETFNYSNHPCFPLHVTILPCIKYSETATNLMFSFYADTLILSDRHNVKRQR